MNVVTLIVAAAIVITGIIYSRINRVEINLPQENKEEVLSESAEEKDADDISPSTKPNATSFPTPTQTTINSNILDYKYPNSQLISSSEYFLSLESSDNSDVITNWYKEKVNSLGMNVKTFVTTKANDKVLNKLVGADGDKEISVEISKENEASSVKISVTIIEK